MNVHHLEIFYYVARYGGIMEAVRRIPWGIGQPAVSGQMAALEKSMGCRLFDRRPFALTDQGAELYDFIAPFFNQLPEIEESIRGGAAAHLRLAASGTVVANHLPVLLEQVRNHHPGLKLSLIDITAGEAGALLARHEIDLALTVLSDVRVPGLRFTELLRLPMVLLVPEDSPVKSFKKLLSEGPLGYLTCTQPLISLPPEEILSRAFQDALEAQNIRWQPRVEVANIEYIPPYVRAGFGIGLTLDIPGVPQPDGLRKVPLPGFNPVVAGIMHQPDVKPAARRFIEAAKALAKQIKLATTEG